MKIKCHTVVSPSHRELLEKYLLPSFPNNPNMEMTITYIPQLCPTGTFYEKGWHDTMHKKADSFISGINSLKDDELYMFIDNDIVIYKDFYEDILKELDGYDIAFQNDIGGGCNTGWFIARNTQSVRNLMQATKMYLGNFDSEQVAITEYCFNNKKYLELKDLKWKMLPVEKYWTYGVYRKTWDGKEDFDIPKDMIIHHGNWCLFKDKANILDYVKNKYHDSRRNHLS